LKAIEAFGVKGESMRSILWRYGSCVEGKVLYCRRKGREGDAALWGVLPVPSLRKGIRLRLR
jgi:hypothetical protein